MTTESSPVSSRRLRAILLPRKAQPFFGRHPWVLASAVDRLETPPGSPKIDHSGAEIDLCNERGKFIARGIYNGSSRIRVRLYTWLEEQELDAEFWQKRLELAVELRRRIGFEPEVGVGDPARSQSAARLVFSEADGLSGLIVDRYGDYLVVQPTSLGMANRLPLLAAQLRELVPCKGLIVRLEAGAAKLEGMSEEAPPVLPDELLGTPPEGPLEIVENGIKYEIDLSTGQKTGFYLDQRENRLAATRYLQGKRVLDLFCYTGGFGLNAAAQGAAEVLGIDSSKKALALAERNATLNGLGNIKFQFGDGFKTLDELALAGSQFDAVVLDPPKFARNRGGLNAALMAYHRLNRSAIALLPPGGILITNSCSGSVTADDFRMMLSGVAQKSGRDIQILEARGAAPDHPVAATCLETEYLKCFICRVT